MQVNICHLFFHFFPYGFYLSLSFSLFLGLGFMIHFVKVVWNMFVHILSKMILEVDDIYQLASYKPPTRCLSIFSKMLRTFWRWTRPHQILWSWNRWWSWNKPRSSGSTGKWPNYWSTAVPRSSCWDSFVVWNFDKTCFMLQATGLIFDDILKKTWHEQWFIVQLSSYNFHQPGWIGS